MNVSIVGDDGIMLKKLPLTAGASDGKLATAGPNIEVRT